MMEETYMSVLDQDEYKKYIEWKNAEEQGKLLILPCKPGDTVYIVINANYTKKIGMQEVVTARITGILSRNKEGETIWCIKAFGKYGEYLIPFEQFGKTVFLTEQEALKALEGMK